MEPVEVARGVFWVGAVDWNVREFHGYSTHRGTTYNAYLVKGEKTALVDTVKRGFFPEMLRRIEALVDPSEIDYVVVNHVEMDHSGALPQVLERAPNAEVVATIHGIKALERHYAIDRPVRPVKSGDALDLGGKTLRFLEAYMLHWPDSMFSYVPEDRLLLSNDGFGQHFASWQRFDDELDSLAAVLEEAAKYFGNILLPTAPLIAPLLKKAKRAGLEIETIAPSHGIIWRSHANAIVQAYLDWSRGVSEERAVVVYDTMWGSTEAMAHAVSEGLTRGGLENRLMHARRNHYSDIVKEILTAKLLVLGSPTLNEGMFPSVAQLLSYLKGLRPTGKKGAAFGSYGWGGEAVTALDEGIAAMGIEVLEPGLGISYVPREDDLAQCRDFGERLAVRVRDRGS